jgi:hypothetical protein
MVVAGKNNGVNVSKPEVVLVSDSADNASDMMPKSGLTVMAVEASG